MTIGISWEEFFTIYESKIAGSLFFAFQGEFEYTGTVHSVRDHFPRSQHLRIILRNVSCRKYEETREWTRFGHSICTIRRKVTHLEEIKKGVFSLQLDDTHHAFVILREAQELTLVA